MALTRRLTVVNEAVKRGFIMKVAFASSDNHHIDQHFGWAEKFAIWDVQMDQACFAGMVQVQSDGADSEDKIAARASALSDCAIVYVTQIGGPAAAKLVALRIHPIKSKGEGEETIPEVVEKLQQVLQGNPPPWLRKAMLKDERPS
ncbi:MAG: nitrogen fixation protein NifX [Syntrophotaleaceae bacterium]